MHAVSTCWKGPVLSVGCLSPQELILEQGGMSKIREGKLHWGCWTDGETEAHALAPRTFPVLLSSMHLLFRCSVCGVWSQLHPLVSQTSWAFSQEILDLVTWSEQAGRQGCWILGWFCAIASCANGQSLMPQVLSWGRKGDFVQRQWCLAFMHFEVLSSQTLSS